MSGPPDNQDDMVTGPPQRSADAIWAALVSGAEPERPAHPGQAQLSGGASDSPTQGEMAGPVGQGDYVVRSGDCITSIARETGHFWETIWNHPANAALRLARHDPNVLLAGDRLTVPEKGRKNEQGATELRHRFMRKGEPARLRLCIMKDDDEPRANEPYTLDIDGKKYAGTTDMEGRMQAPIPGNSRRGRLTVGPPEDQVVYELELGGMEPVTEPGGVIARLNNLGFDAGPAGEKTSEKLSRALSDFQARHQLAVTGRPDAATRQRLLEVHGS